MNLDERIDRLQNTLQSDNEFAQDVKQLIRDVLEYVKPVRGIVVGDEGVDTLHSEHLHKALDYMEAKAKELGL